MRYNVDKTHSTKSERILYEVIKQLKIPFRHRSRIDGMEIDFVINNIAIEINGHEQSVERNKKLIQKGYIPIHFSNEYIQTNRANLKNIILNIIYG